MFKIIKYLLYIISFIFIFYTVYIYWDYFTTPIALRPRLSDYKFLKPGGVYGHGLGIVGSLMMVILLLYSVRKRTGFFGRIGAISYWLDIHIFLGTIGPLLVVLHSTFKLHGLVSVSFWSMVLVAVSGFLGRYLYVQIPRTIRGQELSLNDVKGQSQEIGEILDKQHSLGERDRQNLEQAVAGSFNKSIFGIFFADIVRFWRIRSIKRHLFRRKGIPKKQAKLLIELLVKKVLIDRRIAMWANVHKLFHYWHVFHKPFAIIMYIIMLVHVGITTWLGYTWIF
jgi:hypothetical protein